MSFTHYNTSKFLEYFNQMYILWYVHKNTTFQFSLSLDLISHETFEPQLSNEFNFAMYLSKHNEAKGLDFTSMESPDVHDKSQWITCPKCPIDSCTSKVYWRIWNIEHEDNQRIVTMDIIYLSEINRTKVDIIIYLKRIVASLSVLMLMAIKHSIT